MRKPPLEERLQRMDQARRELRREAQERLERQANAA
jgi:hypothetical protein